MDCRFRPLLESTSHDCARPTLLCEGPAVLALKAREELPSCALLADGSHSCAIVQHACAGGCRDHYIIRAAPWCRRWLHDFAKTARRSTSRSRRTRCACLATDRPLASSRLAQLKVSGGNSGAGAAFVSLAAGTTKQLSRIELSKPCCLQLGSEEPWCVRQGKHDACRH